jgi:hypothetical protein
MLGAFELLTINAPCTLPSDDQHCLDDEKICVGYRFA